MDDVKNLGKVASKNATQALTSNNEIY